MRLKRQPPSSDKGNAVPRVRLGAPGGWILGCFGYCGLIFTHLSDRVSKYLVTTYMLLFSLLLFCPSRLWMHRHYKGKMGCVKY